MECQTETEKNIKTADQAANAKFIYNQDPLAWSNYHHEIFMNLNFQSRQKIAKKYGIKAGDTFTLDTAERFPEVREDILKEK